MVTHVQMLYSRPVSFSTFLLMVNLNTVVRRYLNPHSSLVSQFLSRTAWYQWSAGPTDTNLYSFSGITISAGDVIRLTVTAFTTTSGEAMIEILTNGNMVSESLTSSASLCLESAEWLVEVYMDLPLANFGTVSFIDAVAGGTAGTYTLSGSNATLLDIEQNNQVLTSTSASGPSLTIKYM
jgi:hypothetical protein